MKLLLSAIALAFATPTLAQNAPAGQHAGHAHEAPKPASPASSVCTAGHAAMGHCKPSHATTGQSAHKGHKGDCCEKDASGKMACCEKASAAGKNCCDTDAGASKGVRQDHSGH